jgi:hypothetical protein
MEASRLRHAAKALGMKRDAYRVVELGMLRRSAGVALSLLLVGSVVAAAPGSLHKLATGKQAKQPRVLGKKAVMHLYSYAPKTLEITSVTSLFFTDVDACEGAVGGALNTASSHASEGDLVDAQCVAIDPPQSPARPEETRLPAGVTEL